MEPIPTRSTVTVTATGLVIRRAVKATWTWRDSWFKRPPPTFKRRASQSFLEFSTPSVQGTRSR
eukprot:scaffold40054_cov191-Amphora_coffeaeformis.AAC.2